MSFDEIIIFAESGNTDAMVAAIQEFVWNEHVPVAQSDEIRKKTLEYLNTAILSGNDKAMNQLGAMYAEGRFVDKDPEQAFLFYKMASEHGNVLATSNLGFSYLYGTGTEKNPEEAYKAFTKAALLGMEEAYVRLGDMYRYGTYVSKDIKTAFNLYVHAYKKAKKNLADWGMQQVYSDACLRVGDFYYNGDVVDKNVEESIRWYADAVKYYKIREERADAYSAEGYAKAKERLAQAVKDM